MESDFIRNFAKRIGCDLLDVYNSAIANPRGKMPLDWDYFIKYDKDTAAAYLENIFELVNVFTVEFFQYTCIHRAFSHGCITISASEYKKCLVVNSRK